MSFMICCRFSCERMHIHILVACQPLGTKCTHAACSKAPDTDDYIYTYICFYYYIYTYITAAKQKGEQYPLKAVDALDSHKAPLPCKVAFVDLPRMQRGVYIDSLEVATTAAGMIYLQALTVELAPSPRGSMTSMSFCDICTR